MLLLHRLLEQVLVEIVEDEDIELKDNKVHDFELKNIVNYCIAKITVFDFFFLDINKYNGLDYYRYSTYYY